MGKNDGSLAKEEKKYVARRKRDIKKEAEDNSIFFTAPTAVEEDVPKPVELSETEKKLEKIMEKSAGRRNKRQSKIDAQQAELDEMQNKLDAKCEKKLEKINAIADKQYSDLEEYNAILIDKSKEKEIKDSKSVKKQAKKLEKLKGKKVSRTIISEEQEKLERLQRKNKSKAKRRREKIKASVAAEQAKIDKEHNRRLEKYEKQRSKQQNELNEIQADISAQQTAFDEDYKKYENKVRTGIETKQAREDAKVKKHEDSVQAKADREQAKADKILADQKSRHEARIAKLKEKTTLTPRTDTEDPEAIAEYMQKIEEIESWNSKFNFIMLRVGICVFVLIAVLMVLWNVDAARISLEGKEAYDIRVNVFGMVSSVIDKGTNAILKEEKVKTGSANTVVFRLIDDMYTNPSDGVPYGEDGIVLIGVYGAKMYTSAFEENDFSRGRADMHVVRATKEDNKNSKDSGVTVGRCAVIREYTEKSGGEYKANFEKLSGVTLRELIYRDQVKEEATKSVADVFNLFTTDDDIPVVITDGSTPEPVQVPTPAPTQAPATQKPKSTTAKKSTTTKSTSSTTKSSSSGSKATEKPTSAPSSAPKATEAPKATPSATVAVVKPIKEATRPTANPVGE